MSTASNSTDIQTASGTGPERSNRGNRRYRPRGRFHFARHSSNHREHTSSSNQNSRRSADTRRTFSNSNEDSNSNGNSHSDEDSNLNENITLNGNDSPTPISSNESVCFICANPVIYYAVSECNHKSCHLCSLRIRALYENKNCAYCKTEQDKVIFTRNHDKEFQDFKESDIPYFDENLNAYCEDQEMLDDIKLLLRYNCPYSNCEESCEGWSELKQHTKFNHKLLLCNICIRHKKIFSHEHSLFNRRELDRHFREGDEDLGFKGHPECQFCKRRYYGDDELYEHCRDKHEECFICVRIGIRHSYYRDYSALEEHFNSEHHLCQDRECLEKKFIVFESDIDLKAHEVEVHGTNLSGQRAKHEARRIGGLFTNSYADSHPRRRRSRERQPERRADGDDVIQTVAEEISRQTQNLNLDSTTSAVNGTTVNARAIRPPPGFGALTSDEVIGSANESPESEVQLRNVAYTPRAEDFPTLSDAMGVSMSNNSSANKYSERVKHNPKPVDKPKLADKPKPVDKHKPADKPKPTADRPTQSVASSSRSETPPYSLQPMFESSKKRNNSAFPPLPSTSQSTFTSSSSSSTSTLNYREKALSTYENSSRKYIFHQRVFEFLAKNSAKMDEFNSLTELYSDSSILSASSYIESLLDLFKKNDDVGKVVNGLVEILEVEKKKQELLRAWNDHKAKRTTPDFPALEPVHSPPQGNSKPPPLTKPSPRVLVIKSSTTRSGGAKSSSGPHVWDKIAAIAESRKSNSAFPSLAAPATSVSTPKFVQSSSRSSTSFGVNNSSATTNTSSTTTFVRGRPTKVGNEEFPELPLTPKSPFSQQKTKKNGSENNAWGHGGSFTSVLSDNNKKNENYSEDDSSSYSESTKDGNKKKKQKKQKGKNVIFHVG